MPEKTKDQLNNDVVDDTSIDPVKDDSAVAGSTTVYNGDIVVDTSVPDDTNVTDTSGVADTSTDTPLDTPNPVSIQGEHNDPLENSPELSEVNTGVNDESVSQAAPANTSEVIPEESGSVEIPVNAPTVELSAETITEISENTPEVKEKKQRKPRKPRKKKEESEDGTSDVTEEAAPKKRGRPRKKKTEVSEEESPVTPVETPVNTDEPLVNPEVISEGLADHSESPAAIQEGSNEVDQGETHDESWKLRRTIQTIDKSEETASEGVTGGANGTTTGTVDGTVAEPANTQDVVRDAARIPLPTKEETKKKLEREALDMRPIADDPDVPKKRTLFLKETPTMFEIIMLGIIFLTLSVVFSVVITQREIAAYLDNSGKQIEDITQLKIDVGELKKENQGLKKELAEANQEITDLKLKVEGVPAEGISGPAIDGRWLEKFIQWIAPDGIGNSFQIPVIPGDGSVLVPDSDANHGYLGVTVREDPEKGIVVEEITRTDKDTFKEGDVIIEVDGKEVKTVSDIYDVISKKDVGDVIEVRISRNNKDGILRVPLIEKSTETPRIRVYGEGQKF